MQSRVTMPRRLTAVDFLPPLPWSDIRMRILRERRRRHHPSPASPSPTPVCPSRNFPVVTPSFGNENGIGGFHTFCDCSKPF